MRRLTALCAAACVLAACASDSNDGSTGTAAQVTFATSPTATETTGSEAPGTDTSDTTGVATTGTESPSTAPASTAPLTTESISYTSIATGLSAPVGLALRAGDDTLFVVEQDGHVVPVRDGAVGAPVLDVSGEIAFGGEQGLLGLAFHPTKPLAYVDYTDSSGNTVIAEFAVAADGTFDAASERHVLEIDQPYANHNGGNVVFGPDGYLYIGMGDGGASFDPERRALNVAEWLGKILRIDPVAANGQPYTVPADNPFVGVAGAHPEIWSVGVRNPWRFSFDSATGDLWIGDVGQNEWEEVDLSTAAAGAGRGVNFGWSAMEGTHRRNDDQSPAGATGPIYEYPHGDDGCSISGGVVYHGNAIPSLDGWYVFGDYCSGHVTALHATNGVLDGNVPLGVVSNVVSFGIGADGELYVLSVGEGTLYRVDAA